MFNAGKLILDEVDLILHPLKSELNWPLGAKHPLDFTRSRSGNGLRWQIPLHLLDAIFFATGGLAVSGPRGSTEAKVSDPKGTLISSF